MRDKPGFADYVEIVEILDDPEDDIDVPAVDNPQSVLAELNTVWRKLVGDYIANQSKVVAAYDYKLVVAVQHPVLAGELSVVSDLILKNIPLELEKLDPPLSNLDLHNGIQFCAWR